MAKKTNDIEFLRTKIGNLEIEPRFDLFDQVMSGISPIDGFLEDKIAHIEIEPPTAFSTPIIAQFNKNDEIDCFIESKLQDIEIVPTVELEFNNKSKKWLNQLVLAFLLLIIFLSRIEKLNFVHNENKLRQVSKEKLGINQNRTNETPASRKQAITLNQNKQSKLEEIDSKQSIFLDKQEKEEEIENTFSEHKLLISKFNFIYTLEKTDPIKYSNKLKKKQIKLSKLGYYIGFGIQNQLLNEVQTDPEAMTHEDAISNYKLINGNTLNGIQIKSNLQYLIHPKIQMKIGFSYSYSKKSKQFDYLYNKIPVYGIDGSIIGYFIRPNSNSTHINTPTKVIDRAVIMPIEINYQFFKYKQISFYAGLNLVQTLYKKKTGQYFSFDKETMIGSLEEDSKNQHLAYQLQIIYQINKQVQFQVQLGSQFSKSSLITDQYQIKSKHMINTLNIGLTLIPKMKP